MASENSNSLSASDDFSTGVPNSPDLGMNLKPRVRAIKDEKQLAELIKKLEEENRERNLKNSRIMAKYNLERPHSNAELKAEGLDWMSNFASQPLATLIDRIAPRFARAINAPRYLTASKLRDDIPNAAGKSEKYRMEFTKLVRNRCDWKDLISEIAQEDALFGYTAVAFTDEYEWFPRHYRQDEFFVPASTRQNAAHCPMVILKDTFLPHELFDLISDKSAAKDAGWNIKETVDAINSATTESITKSFSDTSRKYEDLARESNLYSSMATGAKVVVVYHAFVAELTGKVSHYMVEGKDHKMLFEREDRYECMREALTFFSFQQANGKLQASKGVGRTVYALAGIVDRSRNEVINRLQLSGKIIIQGEEKATRQFKMSVVGQAIVISKAYTIVQQKIDAGVEPFMQLDSWVQHLMDEIAGNVSPAAASNQLQGERVTNGQINFLADLQNEAKDSKIERFLGQMASLLSAMQCRAANPHVQDPAAKEFRSACLTVMDEEELKALAEHPAAGTVEDFTDQQRQTIVAICTEVMADPLINRKEALYRKLSAAVDADFATAILLPDNDPTVNAEQTRAQALEDILIAMGKGDLAMPSPRDNHVIHLTVLMKNAEEVAGTVAQDPHNATAMKGFLVHGQAHLQMAMQQGIPHGTLQPFAEQLMKINQGLQHMAQAAQAAQQGGQNQNPGGMPAPGQQALPPPPASAQPIAA